MTASNRRVLIADYLFLQFVQLILSVFASANRQVARSIKFQQQEWDNVLSTLLSCSQSRDLFASLLQLIYLHVGLRQGHHLREQVCDSQVIHLIPGILRLAVHVRPIRSLPGLAIMYDVAHQVILGCSRLTILACSMQRFYTPP